VSIKKRLILILLSVGFMMALFFHFIANTTILPDLKQQKQLTIENQKVKLQVALSEEERDITAFCRGLAKWNGLINYIKTPAVEFERNFFEDSPFLSHSINVILVLDADGRVLYHRNSKNNVQLIPLDNLEIKNDIDEITGQIRRTHASFTGIINSASGPIMLAACPIYNHPPPPPISGLLILGRFMGQETLKRISIHFTETLGLVTFNEYRLFKPLLERMQGTDFFYKGDEEKFEFLYLVKDINQAPSFILKIATKSKLTGIIKKHTLLYVIYTVLSIIFLGFLVYALIEKYITKRISKISLDMKSVQGLKDIAVRIHPDKMGDEISSLIANINETLDKIEREKKSREEIEKLLITREKLVSIGRLTGSIAHEINSPILAISNCLQALKKTCLQKGDKNYDRKEKAITVSKNEIKRIRTLISSLLDFQRSDVEELTAVNLEEVIRQSQEVLRWSKKLSSMKIITKKQQDFFIMGSRGRLKQVFINFILNAAEAADNDYKNKPVLRIEILPSRDKGFCEVHFKDNGPGILPQIKNRLFEPFTSTKEGKNVGLGLYISYKIIKNHQGEILYDDTYKEGAHFIIKLPIKERYS
jgi:signal transduction histidine kinase